MKTQRGRKPGGKLPSPGHASAPAIKGKELLGKKPVHGKENVMASTPKKAPAKGAPKMAKGSAPKEKSSMSPSLKMGKIPSSVGGKGKKSKKGY